MLKALLLKRLESLAELVAEVDDLAVALQLPVK
jgi:hypothetical protein